MLALERQKKILEFLNSDGVVSVNRLSLELGVTEETVRRDLEKLEKQEALRRTHGGAVPIDGGTYEISLEKRKHINVDAKMKLAKEAELDLVKIAPTAKPPVCKIIDYGKYRYELARKEKEAKKKQRTMEVKEVRLSPNIDTNDLNTKANQARKFLAKGDKVKIALRFRGREMAHVNVGKDILDDFYAKLEDVAVVDKPAKLEGRSMVMFLAEKK